MSSTEKMTDSINNNNNNSFFILYICHRENNTTIASDTFRDILESSPFDDF